MARPGWRARDCEETWQWILPAIPAVGISRVAELTWLDEVGVPVWQAVRPGARSVSVSQGKGTSDAAAKVSAVMESIELWHAEHLDEADFVARLAEVVPGLCYDPADLLTAPRHALNSELRLDWTVGRRLDTGTAVPVLTDALRVDGRFRR